MAAAEAEAAAAETGEFAVGERVFVPYVDKVYEAKVLKAEFRRTAEYPDGQWFYFLHYSGWNKKHDAWVEETGLIKAADMVGVPPPETRPMVGPRGGKSQSYAGRKVLKDRFQPAAKKQKQLAAELGAIGGAVVGGMQGAGGAGAGGAGAGGGEAGPGGAGGEAGGSGAGQAGAGAPRGLQLELDISPILKKALLDDHDAIVTDAKLAPLPRSPCVAEVLRRCCERAAEQNGSAAVEQEVAAGLRTYFDKALCAVLLYRSERPQAMALLADGRLPSAVYGTEHLLRLFVKLPDLLAAAGAGGMAEKALLQTATAVQDLMNWVAENLDWLLAPKETYLDHYEYMASLTGEIAEAVAAAGFTGTRVHPGAVMHGAAAAARPVPPTQG